MDRNPLSEVEMEALWRTFLLTDEEIKIERGKDSDCKYFGEAKDRDIQQVIDVLESAGYKDGFRDSADIYVDQDIYLNRVILTNLLANGKRREIEDLLFQTLFNLSVAECICVDVKNHELRKSQRTLISRKGFYVSTEGT